MGISKNDYQILLKLQEDGCITEMRSYTINKLSELTNLSVAKIRIALRIFKLLEYINEGAVSHSAKTYYITKEGIKKLSEL